MFPVDTYGRISFIGEDSVDGGNFARGGRGYGTTAEKQKGLVIMGKPAGTKQPALALMAQYEMKKRLLQFPPANIAARQQRASLDRLPEVRKTLSPSSSSCASPSAMDRSRGKSLSPTQNTNTISSGSSTVFRKPLLKPLAFPLDQQRSSQSPASSAVTATTHSAAAAAASAAPPAPPAPSVPQRTTEPTPTSSQPMLQKARVPTFSKPAAPPQTRAALVEAPASEESAPKKVVPVTKSYKYRFLPGNNGRVILQAFRRRPWWHAIQAEKNVDPASENELVEYDFLWEMYRSSKRYKGDSYKDCCLNHIQYNHSLVTKKGLYFTLRNYCLLKNLDMMQIVPRTFYIHAAGRDDSHIGEGKSDDMGAFLEYNKNSKIASSEEKGGEPGLEEGDRSDSPANNETGIVWICKPASLTNRGFGIQVLRGVDEVLALTKRAISASSTGLEHARAEGTKPSSGALSKAARRRGEQEGWIVQEYMERPLLVSGRKFDIRCFVLLVMTKDKGITGKLKAYFYEDAYVRTSCKKYTMDKLSDRECHLTNDAVQKHAKGYGKFESGNKLTMDEWQTSIEKDYPDAPRNVVFDKILPEIKRLSSISVAAGATSAKLTKTDVSRSFELLGCE